MGDDVEAGQDPWDDAFLDRAVLSESAEGRTIATEFVAAFGAFVAEKVRPQLRSVAAAGGEPQLLVNGLAELMRSVADSIELPPGEPRPHPPGAGPSPGAGGATG